MSATCFISVSFRGEKIEIPLCDDDTIDEFELVPNSTVGLLRTRVAEKSAPALQSTDIKLIYGGKVLQNDEITLNNLLFAGKTPKGGKTFRFMVSGVSQNESHTMAREMEQGLQKAKQLVRDDLTATGQLRMQQRKARGRQMLEQALDAAKRSSNRSNNNTSQYGFGRIETLPNLPDETKAREILTTLANDPGIKACMAKHRWTVGSLAELYPEGDVGESEVCVMGLNKNKGQQILLRIRTDDLKGFRKLLSIREDLYHELAHNVHSAHDGNFFKLMRQIKKECLEMDWTHGQRTSEAVSNITANNTTEGGAHRLGGGELIADEQGLSAGELARRAAIRRWGETQAHFQGQAQCFDCRTETEHEDSTTEYGQRERDNTMDES